MSEHSFATDVSPIVFDLESAPLPEARMYLDPPELEDVSAPANYKDPEKIAAYIADARARALAAHEAGITEKAALDWNVARIVALGWWVTGTREVCVIRNPIEEARVLGRFWALADHRMLMGFRVREFDLPMLLQRSLYLGVPCRRLDVGRFARGSEVIDLYDYLTFNDLRATFVMRRSLTAFARRFGLSVSDTILGSEIPHLVTAGQWDQVEAHCAADVDLTVALAQRVGLLRVDAARETEQP